MQTPIVERGSREDRLPPHRNDNLEAPSSVRRGSYSVRRLKALEESDAWGARGARARAKRSIGSLLGGCPGPSGSSRANAEDGRGSY